MRQITTLIVGAGQSGLAMSRHLSDRSIDHVVLERGAIAHSWRFGRWDSLRLLTPNWLNRLPDYQYQGDDPDGFMSMSQVVDYVTRYAGAIAAPVEEHAEVTSVRSVEGGFRVRTIDTEWQARTVVLASGPYNRPLVPGIASALPPDVARLTPAEYRAPDQLDDGGVLVVGAAATGVQLADEIRRAGHDVTLAVGNHVRLPRTYRGMDIMWWLDAAGVLTERYDEVDDILRARNVASFQLVGSPTRETVDLNGLQRLGIQVVGRLGGITEDGTLQFSGSLQNCCTLADLKLGRLLDSLDSWAAQAGIDSEVEAPQRFAPTRVPDEAPLLLSLRSASIKTVVFATGYTSDYPWLEVPVLDPKGQVRHDGGVTPVPGLYLMGAPFLRTRKSSFIDGAGDDARALSDHLVDHLNRVNTAS